MIGKMINFVRPLQSRPGFLFFDLEKTRRIEYKRADTVSDPEVKKWRSLA